MMNFELILTHFKKQDKVIEELMNEQGVISRHIRIDYYDSIIHSIVSQQISTKAADSIYKKFLAKFSNILDPKIIMEASVEELREVGLSKQKSSYVQDLSRVFLENSDTFENLHEMSDEDVITFLTQIKGIGVWTAQMFLIFTLNRLDVFPIDDFGIKTAMKKSYSLKEGFKKSDLLVIAEKWKPYRSVASLYLWRSLDNQVK